MSLSTQVPGVQGPISSSGAPGEGDSSAAVVRGPGDDHRPAYPATYCDSCIGGAPRSGAPSPMHSPDIIISEPSRPELIEEDVMIAEDVATDMSTPIVPPPPGFSQFSWLCEDWQVGGELSLFTVDEELPGWSPWSSVGLLVDLPLLLLSPIVLDSSDDSVAAQVGSSRDESSTPSEAVMAAPSVGDAPAEFN